MNLYRCLEICSVHSFHRNYSDAYITFSIKLTKYECTILVRRTCVEHPQGYHNHVHRWEASPCRVCPDVIHHRFQEFQGFNFFNEMILYICASVFVTFSYLLMCFILFSKWKIFKFQNVSKEFLRYPL